MPKGEEAPHPPRERGAMGLLTKFFGTEESPTGTPVNHGGPWEGFIAENAHHGPREDSTELHKIDPAKDEPTDIDGLLIAFEYVDASGEFTKRSVLCRRCWSNDDGDIYVGGICQLRKQCRSFRVDRMSHVVELRTKQPITDPETYFAKYAIDDAPKPRRTPKPEVFAGKLSASYGPGDRIADARRVCLDGLRILAYIAILRDGRYTDGDKAIESTYIAARLDDCGMGNDQALAAEVLRFALAIAVPIEAFNASLKILAADQRNFGMVALQLAKVADPVENDGQLAAISQVLAVARKNGLVAQDGLV
jgi:hypothetical protein